MEETKENERSGETGCSRDKEIEDFFRVMRLASEEERQKVLSQYFNPDSDETPKTPLMIRLSNSSEPVCTKE